MRSYHVVLAVLRTITRTVATTVATIIATTVGCADGDVSMGPILRPSKPPARTRSGPTGRPPTRGTSRLECGCRAQPMANAIRKLGSICTSVCGKGRRSSSSPIWQLPACVSSVIRMPRVWHMSTTRSSPAGCTMMSPTMPGHRRTGRLRFRRRTIRPAGGLQSDDGNRYAHG
jgi:hypothetical protein